MEKNTKPSITIAISTIADNLNDFINNFNFFSLEDADEVIIIIQGKIKNKEIYNINQRYIILTDNDFGLSKSRNIAIANAKSDYIWFLDDDIKLIDDSISKIKHYLNKTISDLYTVRMKYLENGEPYKKYSNRKDLWRFDSLGISSVELIVSKNFILNREIRFNEYLGLGTALPCNEENIFFLDVVDKGGIISHIPEYILSHPFINRKNKHYKNPNILIAKGIFCKRYGGITGVLILIYYFVKAIFINQKIKTSFRLFYGYKNAGEILGNV